MTNRRSRSDLAFNSAQRKSDISAGDRQKLFEEFSSNDEENGSKSYIKTMCCRCKYKKDLRNLFK